MPEPTGEVRSESPAVPELKDDWLSEMEALVAAGPHTVYSEGSDVESVARESATPPIAATTSGRPDDGSSAQELAGTEQERETPADPAVTATGEQPDPVDGEGTPGPEGTTVPRTGRGALLTQREQERDDAIARADALQTELDALRAGAPAADAGQPDQQPSAQTGTSTTTAQPVVDDIAIRGSVLAFIGMDAPVDEDGRPTGEEPVFARLDRLSKTEKGIPYEDEQKLYAELTQRAAMAGTIFNVARTVAWQGITSALAEPELGLDEAAVAKTGGIPGWKRAYREALERHVAGEKDTAVAGVRAEADQLRASLEEQLATANRKLEEQAGSFEAKLAAARGHRAPMSGGRSAPAGAPVVAGSFNSSADLTDQLADVFRETASAR